MAVHIGAAAVRAGGGKITSTSAFSAGAPDGCATSGVLPRTVSTGDGHRHTPSRGGAVMLFGGGGGQFGIADAYRHGIVHHALAIQHRRELSRTRYCPQARRYYSLWYSPSA